MRVLDSTTPAVSVAGTMYNGELAYVFYDKSNKVIGSIPDSELNTIIWENSLSSFEDDEQHAWFVENFNLYRGIDGGEYVPPENPNKPVEFDAEAFCDELIRLTNKERERAGLDPLVTDSTAMEYAAIRAEELAEKYSHTRPDGDNSGMYSHYSFGENIAYGQKTSQEVINDWMGSDGHRAAILADYSDYGNRFGVGVYKSQGIIYWCQEFIGWDANA